MMGVEFENVFFVRRPSDGGAVPVQATKER